MVVNITSISGEHVYVESGVPVLISGQAVVIDSGLYVVADIAESGMGVQVQSGIYVLVSGQHMFQESGAFVQTQPDISVSGSITVISGTVVVDSGLHVMMSGQHVFVESGVHVVTGESGAPVQMLLQDSSGNIAGVSKRHCGLIITPDITREVHKGEMYHVSYCQSGLAADGDIEMLIFPCSGKEVHTTFGIQTGGANLSRFYENVAFTNSGTLLPIHNMNRVTSGQPDTICAINPVGTSGGLELWCEVGGGGGKFTGGPGTTRTEVEWILNGISGVIPYLLVVNNRDAGIQDASLSMGFTEEEPVFWE